MKNRCEVIKYFLKEKIRGKTKECSNYFGALHMPYRYQRCQWLTPKTLRSTYKVKLRTKVTQKIPAERAININIITTTPF